MQRHVYFYTHVPTPFEPTAGVLAGDPARWLPLPAREDGDAWQVVLRAEGALPARLAEHPAAVSLGAAAVSDGRLLRALSWHSSQREQVFPVLTADLGLDALEGDGSHLSLMGTYRPPLSVVGGAGDVLLGHRVAEAVVRRFVLDVADRLLEAVKAGVAGP